MRATDGPGTLTRPSPSGWVRLDFTAVPGARSWPVNAARVATDRLDGLLGPRILRTLRQPNSPSTAAPSTMPTNTIRNASHRQIQVSRARRGRRRRSSTAARSPARMKRYARHPLLDVAGDLRPGQLDLGAHQRGDLRGGVLDQLPIDGSADNACGSTSGMDVTVLGMRWWGHHCSRSAIASR